MFGFLCSLFGGQYWKWKIEMEKSGGSMLQDIRAYWILAVVDATRVCAQTT